MTDPTTPRPRRKRRHNRPRKLDITIDLEVHKAIEALRLTARESHSDILLRLFKLKPAEPPPDDDC